MGTAGMTDVEDEVPGTLARQVAPHIGATPTAPRASASGLGLGLGGSLGAVASLCGRIGRVGDDPIEAVAIADEQVGKLRRQAGLIGGCTGREGSAPGLWPLQGGGAPRGRE